MKPPKIKYQSRLPHIAPIGASFFVTFRLADSLPQKVVARLKLEFNAKIEQLKKDQPKNYLQLIRNERKRFFGKYDHELDGQPYGSCALKQPEIAALVQEQLHRYDGELYDLMAYCIMSNHVHILIDTSIQVIEYQNFNGRLLPVIVEELPENLEVLHQIMKKIKGASAFYANQILGKTGQSFWQKDSYDHYVRNEKEWQNIFWYILNNPVKARLVERWEDWTFSYFSPTLQNP